MTNALRDDTSLAGSSPRDDEQRPIAMCNCAALRFIQFQSAFRRRIEIEEGCHDLRRVAEFLPEGKRDSNPTGCVSRKRRHPKGQEHLTATANVLFFAEYDLEKAVHTLSQISSPFQVR